MGEQTEEKSLQAFIFKMKKAHRRMNACVLCIKLYTFDLYTL
jgi:hypothetical protein